MNFIRERKEAKYVDISNINERIEEMSYYNKLYEVSNIEGFQEIMEFNLNKINSNLNFFNKIHIRWSNSKKNKNNAIAEYVHSSALNSNPLIVLYQDTMYDELMDKEDHYESNLIIAMTLFHEIGHAIVDIDSCYIFNKDNNLLKFNDEEDYVENFASEFFYRSYIPNDIKNLCDKFKNKKWVGIDSNYEVNY